MKINGALSFDASSASEIQNLRVEKFADIAALGGLTSATAADAGRLVFVTATGVVYVGVGTNWVPFATGGDASALLAEVDAMEAALGLNTNGTFNAANYTGNLANSTSLPNVLTKVQTELASGVAATAAEATRALAAEGVLTDDLSAEITRATNAETTLTTDLGDEITRASDAEVALGTRIDNAEDAFAAADAAEVTARDAAILVETNARIADVNAEETRATAAEGAEATARAAADTTLQGNIDAEATARTAADTTLQNNINTEATTRGNADTALGVRIDTEITDRTEADTTLQSNITAEAGTRAAADTTLQNNINAEAATRATNDATNATAIGAETTRATAAEAALQASADAFAQGLSWKAPVAAATLGNVDLEAAASGYDGVTLDPGDRVLVRAQTAPEENGIYVFSGIGAPLTRATDMDIAAEFLGATVYVVSGSQTGTFTETATVAAIGTDPVIFAQVQGAGVALVAGAGLTKTGNNIDVGAADASITVTADAIQVSAALQTAISDSTTGLATEITNRTNADNTLQGNIDAEATARAAADTAEVAARNTAIGVETTRATAAEGVIADNLATEITDRAAAITAEVAARNTAIGVETTRATAAEGALGTRIDGVEDDFAAADAAEVTARDAAIAVETSRATAAEGAIADDLADEVTARTTADTTQAAATALVQTNLTTEVTARTNADTAINTRIGKMYFLYDNGAGGEAASATTHVVTHNLGQSYCNVTVISGNEVVIPQSIVFNTLNQLTITFNTAVATRAVVMGLAP